MRQNGTIYQWFGKNAVFFEKSCGEDLLDWGGGVGVGELRRCLFRWFLERLFFPYA